MRAGFSFVFVVFFVTAALIGAVSLRNANNCVFYKLCTVSAEQSRLRQQLWQKQLQWEALTNPGAIVRQLEQ